MPKGYWIARVDVTDEEGYKPYVTANPAIFKKFGGRFLVRGGKFECPEGESRSRNIVIEFPDYAAALACYRSPEYQANIEASAAQCDRRHRDHRGIRRPHTDVGRPSLRRGHEPCRHGGSNCHAGTVHVAWSARSLARAFYCRCGTGTRNRRGWRAARFSCRDGDDRVRLRREARRVVHWQGPPGGGAVVLMHGVKGNRLAMLRRARLLHTEGFSVLLFDFQAHGESTGTRITFGRLEGLDAAAAVAFVRQRLPNEKIGAIGSSLGGAAALLGPEPLAVDALVLESVYSDIGTAIANRIRIVLGPVVGALAARPTAWLFEAILPPFLGMRPSDLRPIDGIAQGRAPRC